MSIKILDTSYAHQAHQYEFFKLPYEFTLCNSRSSNIAPTWNVLGRPMPKGLEIKSMGMALRGGGRYDVIIHRVNSRPYKYGRAIKFADKVIAVVQTTEPFKIPEHVTHVVWNSYVSMKNHSSKFPKFKHFYIPHGFDPNEFQKIDNAEKVNDVLFIGNDFLERRDFLNYPLWYNIKNELTKYDFQVYGSQRIFKNKKKWHKIYNNALRGDIDPEKIDEKIRVSKSFKDLINIYNSFKVYFNPTNASAMPRGRGEAMMCGVPIVTSDNYDIGMYLKNGEDCILSNDYSEIKNGIKNILEDKDLREHYSNRSREVAIENFHIDLYLSRWKEVIEG